MPVLSNAIVVKKSLQQRTASTIEAPCGAIRGAVQDGVRIFKGIPYAQAPVGNLRFKAPQPTAQFPHVFNAFSFGSAPIQPERIQAGTGRKFIGNVGQSEDCLYLNVWAPEAPGPHPVFVWIYGGSNIYGATSQPLYDGTNFAKNGVVCVTIGYRLGALGFLELGKMLGSTFEGSGNNALRDQIHALKWVKENIASFGGNPKAITVGGESAGGKNLSALLAAPLSRGLFQQAVIQSGGAMTTHSLSDAQEVAHLFASNLQELDPTSPIDKLLFNADASSLLKAQIKTVQKYKRNFPFRTVTDGMFMPESPQSLLNQGASKEINLLIGSNRDEALLFFPPGLVDKYRQHDYAETPISTKEMAQTDLRTMQSADTAYKAAFPLLNSFERRLRLLTAEEYWIPTIRVAEAHSNNGGRTYVYRFDEAAKQGPFLGYAVHASEQPFTWHNFNEPFLEMIYGKNATPPPLADVMHQTWVSFIKSGVPSEKQIPTWPVYSTNNRQTMIFSSAGCAVALDPAGDERRLWETLLT